MKNNLNNLFEQYSPKETDSSKDNTTISYSEMINKKDSKVKVEDTHKRMTFLVENDLKDEFNELTEGKWGLKTKLINKAIRDMLNEIKQEQI